MMGPFLAEYQDALTHYAAQHLWVQSKNQGLITLQLNRAQSYIHQQLEKQKKQTGRVRAIILKGRQQGCSTYIAARFYQQVTTQKGLRVFIITHSNDATQNLFSMVDRFHEHTPEETKQPTRIASAKEKYFHLLESGYRVGTAGSKGVGRSQTIQLLHASEVAFWPHADTHIAGIIQAVPDMEGTEIILESTACGIGNRFQRMWQDASTGKSEYVPIFVPWYWQSEYRKTPPDGWRASEEAQLYGQTYGLDQEQLYWRSCKQNELGSPTLFCQEYPANAAEAFHMADPTRFIDSQLVMSARAQQEKIIQTHEMRIGGCDPARFGDDRTSFCLRVGKKVESIMSYQHLDTMAVTGLCVRFIEEKKLDKLCIDVVGLGAGVYDRLKELGYGNKILAVNAACTALNKTRYHNKRAEMWDQLRQWLQQIPCHLPDSDSLHADLTMPGFSYDSQGRLLIESKESMRSRGMVSPDEADALALTFAVPSVVCESFRREHKLWFYRPQWVQSDYAPF